MFPKLVSRNDDLRRMVEKGYAVAFDSNHLIVRDVPYLDAESSLQWGALVAKLEFIDTERVKQTDHQVFFAGSAPYGLDRLPIRNLGGGPCTVALSKACPDVVVQRSFSNKPRKTGRYDDFCHKIDTYVALISGPAIEKFGVTPYTFRIGAEAAEDPIFKLQDTLTSRAEISDLREKFVNDVVVIIGLGGTGAYVLDFLIRTPVREIRAFDADAFHVHNAFRSPGRVDAEELGKPKAEVYASRFEPFRHGLRIENKFIDASSDAELEGVTFAFVCVDKGSSRAAIFELLASKGIPYIDVGMGLHRKHGALSGMMRMTYYSSEQGDQVRAMRLAEINDPSDDLYRANIQIGELNALNACLAVIRFKQIRGFYHDEVHPYNALFQIGDLSIVAEAELP